MKSQAGFTVFELMCTISLFAVICTTIMTMERNMYRRDRTMHGYVTDLAECRRALRHLERDLRVASGVEQFEAGYRIQTAEHVIAYTLVDGVLSREVAGRRRAAGRRIGGLSIVSHEGYVDLTVQLQRRSAPKHVPMASVHTSVFLRGGSQ